MGFVVPFASLESHRGTIEEPCGPIEHLTGFTLGVLDCVKDICIPLSGLLKFL